MSPSAPVKLSHLAISDDILKECSAIEVGLEELKTAYEQYFLGMDRQPPVGAHQRLRKRFQQLESTFNRTTSVRFRVQSLSSRFLTYERLWHRTMEQIENGTYKRDLFKARMHWKERQHKSASSDPVLPPAPSAPAAPGNELSESKLRAVYGAYLEAKKRCGEDVSKISFDAVAAKLRSEVPRILEKHRVSGVEFKVSVKDGKATLRVVPTQPAKPHEP